MIACISIYACNKSLFIERNHNSVLYICILQLCIVLIAVILLRLLYSYNFE